MADFDPLPLPDGVASRSAAGVNGLDMHYLEAGKPGAPVILLLHGFPELAYSWRKVMPLLAGMGFRVIAPDQRGYGRTTGGLRQFSIDLFTYRMPNLVRDALGLLRQLEIDSCAHVIGHDFGAAVAGWAGLLRPDVFRTVTVASAPFVPPSPVGAQDPTPDRIDSELARLERPRKHYQGYYSTPSANPDMMNAPGGLAAFLRAYFYMKSADWDGNAPRKLAGWTAEALAEMPTYYIMENDQTMPEAVAGAMPEGEASWLTDAELAVYAAEFGRTGFQGGLNWYRCRFISQYIREAQIFGDRRIEAPMTFIAGASDWGVYQTPGALQAMSERSSTDFRGAYLIDGAGHWVQQERPQAFVAAFKQAMEI